jgi:hypothetical protein
LSELHSCTAVRTDFHHSPLTLSVSEKWYRFRYGRSARSEGWEYTCIGIQSSLEDEVRYAGFRNEEGHYELTLHICNITFALAHCRNQCLSPGRRCSKERNPAYPPSANTQALVTKRARSKSNYQHFNTGISFYTAQQLYANAGLI